MTLLKEMHDKGVRFRVLINSLASNDVLAAHAGYSHRQMGLLENGIKLYELHPYPGPVKKRLIAHTSKAALHTKGIVFDRKDLFIGSFNLDPRSGEINTEAGLYLESPELAAQDVLYMDRGVIPEDSYRMQIEDGEMVWISELEGKKLRETRDPGSS